MTVVARVAPAQIVGHGQDDVGDLAEAAWARGVGATGRQAELCRGGGITGDGVTKLAPGDVSTHEGAAPIREA